MTDFPPFPNPTAQREQRRQRLEREYRNLCDVSKAYESVAKRISVMTPEDRFEQSAIREVLMKLDEAQGLADIEAGKVWEQLRVTKLAIEQAARPKLKPVVFDHAANEAEIEAALAALPPEQKQVTLTSDGQPFDWDTVERLAR